MRACVKNVVQLYKQYSEYAHCFAEFSKDELRCLAYLKNKKRGKHKKYTLYVNDKTIIELGSRKTSVARNILLNLVQ